LLTAKKVFEPGIRVPKNRLMEISAFPTGDTVPETILVFINFNPIHKEIVDQ